MPLILAPEHYERWLSDEPDPHDLMQSFPAAASLWVQGELVHEEDLVLHDAGMNLRPPTHQLTRSYEVLRARRLIAHAEPDWALSPSGLDELRGRSRADDSWGSSKQERGALELKENRDEKRTAMSCVLTIGGTGLWLNANSSAAARPRTRAS